MKIGIVSSYSDLCGNATYTKALQKEFERQGHTVHVFDLKSIYFNTKNVNMQRKGDQLIAEFCREIPSFDYINLQIEQVLYGLATPTARQHISSLIAACKNAHFSVTFHSVPHALIETKKKRGIKKIISAIKNKTKKKVTWETAIFELIELAYKKDGLIIVHNEREKEKILSKFPQSKVVAHPLSMYNINSILKIKSDFSKTTFANKYDLSLEKKYIGAFGFLGENKSFETVISALSVLPKNFHLCIWGGQHPLTFSWFPNGSPYIEKLIDLVRELGLTDRVLFMGAQETDQDMIEAMLFSDYVVLPYLEVGQNASAVASMAIAFASNPFFSRNDCFKELKRYSNDAFFSFDMCNYLELANKIKSLPNKEHIENQRKVFLEKYNVTTNCELYLNGGVVS